MKITTKITMIDRDNDAMAAEAIIDGVGVGIELFFLNFWTIEQSSIERLSSLCTDSDQLSIAEFEITKSINSQFIDSIIDDYSISINDVAKEDDKTRVEFLVGSDSKLDRRFTIKLYRDDKHRLRMTYASVLKFHCFFDDELHVRQAMEKLINQKLT